MAVTSSTIIDHLRREHRNMLDLARRFGATRQLDEFEAIVNHFGSMNAHKLEAFIPSLLRKVEELKYDAVREAQERRLPLRQGMPGKAVSYRGIDSFYPGLAIAVDEEAMRVRTVLAEMQNYEAALQRHGWANEANGSNGSSGEPAKAPARDTEARSGGAADRGRCLG